MFGLFKKNKDSHRDIGLEGFEEFRQKKGVVTLDVRTTKEIASGAVPGHLTRNIHLQE